MLSFNADKCQNMHVHVNAFLFARRNSTKIVLRIATKNPFLFNDLTYFQILQIFGTPFESQPRSRHILNSTADGINLQLFSALL